MAGILGGILSAVSSGLLGEVNKVVDELHFSGEEKLKLKNQLQAIVQKRDSEIEQTVRQELTTRENIIVAELQQGDLYTKRARPTVIYFGLFIIFFNYCFVPTVQTLKQVVVQAFALPVEFWVSWGGVVGIYAIGRSAEKRGVVSKLVQVITGTKKVKSDKLRDL